MAGGRGPSSPPPASPSVIDDILTEILLRLPPAPSSLPRASLVCKRWHRLISDPAFLRRFSARHRRDAPLLGFFTQGSHGNRFMPILEPPDRIPHAAFSFLDDLRECHILCCRDGLVLLFLPTRLRVWNASAGYFSELSVPQGLDCWTGGFNGTVVLLRDEGDAHGDEHYLVAVVTTKPTRVLVCVYSSETGDWGKPISTVFSSSSMAITRAPGTSLYWALSGYSCGILEFDLDKQCLTVIDVALSSPNVSYYDIWVMAMDDGLLGFLFPINGIITVWKRSADCGWVLERSIDLDKLLPHNPYDESSTWVIGVAEEWNLFFLKTEIGVFKVHTESMQCQKISEMSKIYVCHSFTSVYTAGLDGGADGDDPLH